MLYFPPISSTGLGTGFKSSIEIPKGQCPRTDLNKKFLPRPKTTTA